jgi:hypothetical protein
MSDPKQETTPSEEDADALPERTGIRDLDALNFKQAQLARRRKGTSGKRAPTRLRANADQATVDAMLERTAESDAKNKTWLKLTKTERQAAFGAYCDALVESGELEADRRDALYAYLCQALNRKKLTRLKEVMFDVETQTIKRLPTLVFHPTNKTFTLRSKEKAREAATLKRQSKKPVRGGKGGRGKKAVRGARGGGGGS